jgi:ABC-type antimicrobial peptide transport system permease subunit
MIRNYFKVAWRNLIKSKGYSLINIGGLATGMAVAILIGLWIYDEVSFNRYHENYSRVAQVMQNQTFNGTKGTENTLPYLTADEIRNKFSSDFKYVAEASWDGDYVLSVGDRRFMIGGQFFGPKITEILSLKMIHGTRDGLKEPYSILLSKSVAKIFFGDDDPVGKTITFGNKYDLKVTGVYEDFPYNSSFNKIKVFLPWDLFLIMNQWIKKMEDPWGSNFTQCYAMIADNADMEKVSAKIKDVKYNKVSKDEQRYKAEVFLHPMSNWHLYSDFKKGVNTGGRIEFVWLFGIIGIFVLLLACINFMNLSTARSEKRAKEVGIRKAIGSMRRQLIKQFFAESLLVVFIAFLISLIIVTLVLPAFNDVADKKMVVLWTNPLFWIYCLVFILFTGLIAGSYPALYLSSFHPVKILKGTFKVGRFSAVPRKVMVVIQFTVSVALIIGTVIVFQQIQYAKDRPIGYQKDGLLRIPLADEVYKHYEAVRTELKNERVITEMAISQSPLTNVWNTNGGFNWEGKDPNMGVDFPNNTVSYEYGKTIGWTIKEGRDFSRDFASDSTAFIINESAVKFLGFKDPVGKILEWEKVPYTIIGVVKDLLVESPYYPVRASLYHLATEQENLLIIRLNRDKSAKECLNKIESVLKRYEPKLPFVYNFTDEEFANKFGNEERIGRLASYFSVLAIFISCLGLFGLASFVAEQRTKEIGIRKVLGASVMSLWRMLSKDFIFLVLVSCFVAIPVSYFYLKGWLAKYDYRIQISWWVFASAGACALLITILVVSSQAIKAALANPAKSLKTE